MTDPLAESNISQQLKTMTAEEGSSGVISHKGGLLARIELTVGFERADLLRKRWGIEYTLVEVAK